MEPLPLGLVLDLTIFNESIGHPLLRLEPPIFAVTHKPIIRFAMSKASFAWKPSTKACCRRTQRHPATAHVRPTVASPCCLYCADSSSRRRWLSQRSIRGGLTQASLSGTASRRLQLATNAAAPRAVAFDLSDAVERLVAILGVTEGILGKTVLRGRPCCSRPRRAAP